MRDSPPSKAGNEGFATEQMETLAEETRIMKRTIRRSLALLGVVGSCVLLASETSADAASRGARGTAASRPANVQSANVQSARADIQSNRSTTVNRNQNVNVNRNVNVENNYYRGGGGYYGGYNRWGRPVAAAAAVTATAIAVGTVVAALPASGCTAVVVGGVGYQRCGPTYYQPTYESGDVQYIVVSPPE